MNVALASAAGPLAGIPREAAGPRHPVWAEIAPELTPRDFQHPHAMDASFLRLLSRARRRTQALTDTLLGHTRGVPFRIISDYRPPASNYAAGGAEHSAHLRTPTRVVDLQLADNAERFIVAVALLVEGFTRLGIYEASAGDGRGGLHVDAEDDLPAPRIWTLRG